MARGGPITSESLYHAVLAGSLDAIVVVGSDASITGWNPAAERTFGWDADEAIGQPWTILIPGSEGPLPAIAGGVVHDTSLPGQRKDGSVFEANVRVVRVDESSYVAIVRDVTERVLLDKVAAAVSDLDPIRALDAFAPALRQVVPFSLLALNVVEGDQLRRLISTVGDVPAFAEGVRIDVHGTSSELLLEHTGRMIVPVVVEDTSVGEFEQDAHLAELGVCAYVTLPLIHERRVFATMTVGWADRPPTEWEVELLASIAMAIATSVRNILAFEQEREEVRRLEDLDRLKDDFLSGVSHELRTPLAALKGFVQLALLDWSDMPDEDKVELLQKSYRNIDELGRLVEQLLDFSRLAEDRTTIELRPMKLARVVRELLDRMGPVVGHHRLDVEIPEDLSVMVDDNGIDRVLTNLISNAVKFTPRGAGIRIVAESGPDEVAVRVIDEGTGIAPEHHEKIFDRFYQAGPAISSRRGTGIGLAIVARYVELMGGRVWLESEPGRGSTFTFTLPTREAYERQELAG